MEGSDLSIKDGRVGITIKDAGDNLAFDKLYVPSRVASDLYFTTFLMTFYLTAGQTHDECTEGRKLEGHVYKLPLSSDTTLCTTMATLVVAEPPHNPMLQFPKGLSMIFLEAVLDSTDGVLS